MTFLSDKEPQQVESDEAMNIMEYVAVCRERIWLIASLAVICGIMAALWSYSQIKIFHAVTQVVIEQRDPKLINTQLQQEMRGAEQFETHVRLMTSYPVLEEVVKVLNLSQQPEYQYRPSGPKVWIKKIETEWLREILLWVWETKEQLVKTIKSSIKSLISSEVKVERQTGIEEAFPKTKEASLVRAFKGHVKVSPVSGSRIVEIAVMSISPDFAALAANTLAQVYIDRTQKKKSEFREYASDWFASQLDDLRDKVEESEQALYAFRAKHGLVNLSNQQTIAARRLDQINMELIQAEKSRTEAQTRYKQIESIRAKVRSQEKGAKVDRSDLDSLTEVLNSTAIRGLRTQEIGHLVELANLSEKYGPLHPKMIQARTKLKELQARMAEELDKVYGSVKNNFQLALARERAIQGQVKDQKAKKVALDKYAVQASILERESNSNRELYDLFLSQMSQTDLSTKIQTSNIYIAESAIPNKRPIKPKTTLNTILGIFLGLCSGLGLTFFLEYGGKKIKGPRDLERYFEGILTLGMVPKTSKAAKGTRTLDLLKQPLGIMANCFRHIRTSLWITLESEPPFAFAITSPSDQEGKTTLAANLAISLAQVEGVRVVLIDTDLRRPRLGGIFGLNSKDPDKSKGLVHFLDGEAEESEILHDTNVPNLAVIPAGYTPPHPTELLHSKRMEALLQWCREQGFSVILDTPAALPVVDAMVVSNMVSGTILVVSAGQTKKQEATTVLDQLNSYGIKILGVVMQKVPLASLPAYYRESPYFIFKDRKNA